jgi:hypothetical protein
LAILIILGYLFGRILLTPRRPRSNLFLNVVTSDQDATFNQINSVLTANAKETELRRLDRSNGDFQATYLIQCEDDKALTSLMDNLRAALPNCEMSFVEQDNTLAA